MALDTSTMLSRRSVLAGTIGGLAALAAAAIGRPAPTMAHDPDDVGLTLTNTALGTTTINMVSNVGDALHGKAPFSSGAGLRGTSAAGNGVFGVSTGAGATSIYGLKENAGTAVWGEITDPTSGWGAVFGSTRGSGPGVIGESSGPGRGTWGRALGTGDGIYGESTNGRGGRFKGKKAQIRLDPSTASTHPTSGVAGDIFLDKSKRLWLCKGTTTWARLDL